MGIPLEQVWAALDSLLDYAQQRELLCDDDRIYARNLLLGDLGLEQYVPQSRRLPFPDCLELLCCFGVQQGLCGDTVAQRDLLDTRLMGRLTPPPSQVIGRFRRLYEQEPRAATDYLYRLSQDCHYIRRDRIARDVRWQADTPCGALELSINLSKPEKDPRDIAAAGARKATGYPACQLCVENEGYRGHTGHPARQNLRIIPLTLAGEPWELQYSPYVYYDQHCIVMNRRHVPMVIDGAVFRKLFAFVEQFPHYFIGSNADLPIVGGSILSHEHFQGGCYTFPMERAAEEQTFTVNGFDDVHCAVLRYPMTVLRLRGQEAETVCRLAEKILTAWRRYSDPQAMLLAETNGVPHHTITPIARLRQGQYELDLVLRSNLTTPEYPMGLYHPHPELHHIKKENIGLIEVMGLAVLPGRLKGELQALKETLLAGRSPAEDPALAPHAPWAAEVLSRHPEWNAATADDILRHEVGQVFYRVLECAGVYPCIPAGRTALGRFLATLNQE